MIREPAVAGYFYPAQTRELIRQVDEFTIGCASAQKRKAIACLVPHAGYMFSGHVAGAVYTLLEFPRRFIILCPRHRPPGQPLAIMSAGAWRTPLGDAKLDEALAGKLLRTCTLLREDSVAHRDEHSLEVQLPFLQRLVGDFTFVPIALGTDRFSSFDELGNAIAAIVAKEKEPVLLIASSDMNHYESDAVTRVKDRMAIERILAIDPRGLYDTVRREDITMCGYGPAVTMLTAAKILGATRAELVKYATSGDINAERDRVVGYAGVIVE
jgi:hypothetical protein